MGSEMAEGLGTSHDLVRLSATDIAVLPKDNAIVVQPIGSIEQHGPHLPVGTDAFVAEAVVRGSVALLGDAGPQAWILPTLSYGRSIEHEGFDGVITLSTDTLLGVCRDVGRSVAASGFKRLVFVNGHGGNLEVLDVVLRDIHLETGLMVFRIAPVTFGTPEGLECPDAEFGAHADFLETSMMLALDPSMVHMDRAQAGGEAGVQIFGKHQVHGLGPLVTTGWLTSDMSSNGVLGDPRGATAEIGRRIVDHWQARIADCYREIARFSFGAAS
jgi:creatinine amidohydrolase